MPRTPRHCSMPCPRSGRTIRSIIYSRVQRARAGRALRERRRLARQGQRATCPTPPSGGTSAARSSASCWRRARTSSPTAPPPATPKAPMAAWSRRISTPAGSPSPSSTTPRAPETHFAAMTGHSTLPESVAQANYWLGRARLALGKDEAAKEAFTAAAAYPDDLLRPAVARGPRARERRPPQPCPTRPAARPRSRRSR